MSSTVAAAPRRAYEFLQGLVRRATTTAVGSVEERRGTASPVGSVEERRVTPASPVGSVEPEERRALPLGSAWDAQDALVRARGSRGGAQETRSRGRGSAHVRSRSRSPPPPRSSSQTVQLYFENAPTVM